MEDVAEVSSEVVQRNGNGMEDGVVDPLLEVAANDTRDAEEIAGGDGEGVDTVMEIGQ
jgi:hypothetical protein